MTYYERIRELREDNDFTQASIAELLGVGQRTYSDYESGKIRLPIDSLITLAKYYNVNLDYLSGASNIKHPYPGS